MTSIRNLCKAVHSNNNELIYKEYSSWLLREYKGYDILTAFNRLRALADLHYKKVDIIFISVEEIPTDTEELLLHITSDLLYILRVINKVSLEELYYIYNRYYYYNLAYRSITCNNIYVNSI